MLFDDEAVDENELMIERGERGRGGEIKVNYCV